MQSLLVYIASSTCLILPYVHFDTLLIMSFLRKSNTVFTHPLEPAKRLPNSEGSASLLLDLFKSSTLSDFNQLETTTVLASPVNVKDSEVGNNPANDSHTSQGKFAGLDNLRSAVLVGMCSDDNDLGLVRIGDKVHGATHTLNELAWNHVVGQVTVGRNFHGTENGDINMTTSDHTEGFGGVEDGSTRNEGDGFLTGVDNVTGMVREVSMDFMKRGTEIKHTHQLPP